LIGNRLTPCNQPSGQGGVRFGSKGFIHSTMSSLNGQSCPNYRRSVALVELSASQRLCPG